MEKLYTDKEYSQKAIEANSKGEQLYIYQHKLEYEVEVLEYEYEDIEVDEPVLDDETGEPILVEQEVTKVVHDDELGINKEITTVELVPKTEKVIKQVIIGPKLIEKEILNPETGKVETVLVQASHTETRTKDVEELLIAPFNYYICLYDNITDGTINKNYNKELKQKEIEHINSLTCTKRVFVLMLQELGFDYYNDILPKIESDSVAKLEWDLCVELLRNNPLLDEFGKILGITSEQIDYLFRYANGEISLEDFKQIIAK